MVLCLLLLVCFSLSLAECSQPWSKVSIATRCERGEILLCDLDNVLNVNQSESLRSLLRKDLGKEGDCVKKINVVIIRHLANPYGQEINEKMEEAADYLRDAWREECPTLTVLLLSTGDARIRTSFYGLSGLCWNAVKETHKKYHHYLFDQKEYGIGLEKIIHAYQLEIKNPDSCYDVYLAVMMYVRVFFSLILLALMMTHVGLICCFCCCGGGDPGDGVVA